MDRVFAYVMHAMPWYGFDRANLDNGASRASEEIADRVLAHRIERNRVAHSLPVISDDRATPPTLESVRIAAAVVSAL